ncbi:similar to nucleolar protein NOP52 variant [Plenodomus lingam JN3]|uniref:Similar to nucleolar protein NOP52 variant n=1 Tax=Leptosphaeria maculans (strain JN3 / isolate v23.1.3 / race Av1-4-5-6-7-8) TaxID=985895 RepID=E4ZLI3_LEPMJ|nr:similar to nucleolar protein NOP52 variant [Plenodomus lingam JN3]CBX92342.1 similar to nucleolar protein NOP52 variant [Plenodomus lingam JN3]
MASDAQDSPFIRNLASSDKKIRDHALNSLKTYLGAQSEISELDLLKLWKGLFYCLWMQDKPVLQQRLSRDLASLVPTLRTPVVLPFLRAFFLTIAREWKQIEALRLDKYLYLIRQYINASFTFLSRNNWEKSLVTQWNAVVEETPLESQNMRIPNGLRYHVLDVWVEEMDKVDGEEWYKEERREILELLVLPIEKLAKEGKLKALRSAAKECLGEDKLRAWRGQVDDVSEEPEDEDQEAEWGGIADD